MTEQLDQVKLAKYVRHLRTQTRPADYFVPLDHPQLDQRAFFESKKKNKGVFGGNRELAYGTQVRLANGESIAIEDIKIGDNILCWDRGSSFPVRVIDIPYDDYSETWKATTKCGLEVESSLDHCFPAFIKSEVGKHTLEEIRDFKSPYKKFVSSGLQLYNSDEKLMFSGLLLGLYLGDGSSSISPSNKYPSCSFTNTEKNIRDMFTQEILNSFPDVNVKAYPSDETRIHIIGKAKGKNHFLNALRYYHLDGLKSDKKFIPDVFRHSTIKTRREVIRGLILTDGGVDKYKTTIYSNSLRMLEDIEEIIVSLGGRSKTYKDGSPENENQNQQYKLQFSNKILEDMGIGDLGRKNPKYKIGRVARRDDLIIESVVSTGVKKCRCLTIDHLSHTFVLANGIVTYNSGKTISGAVYVIQKCLDNPGFDCWGATWADLSVAIQQTEYYKMLPKDKSVKYAKFTAQRGFSNRIILFENGSQIRFKTYDQGRESFQGASKDIIHLDEEPDQDIVSECKARLIDRNGEMIRTMTPLRGVTYTADEFLENEIGDPEVEFWYWDNRFNEHIDQKNLKRIIGGFAKKEQEVRQQGHFLNLTTGNSYYPFSEENIIDSFTYMNGQPLEVSCDFNVDLMCWNIAQERQGKDFLLFLCKAADNAF